MQQKKIQSITPPSFARVGDIHPGQIFVMPTQHGRHFLRVENHMNAVCLEDGKPWSFDPEELASTPACCTFTISW